CLSVCLSVCLSLSVSYRIGQLYMISKHSHEQSERGEGVEVVQNEPYEDPTHGQGQFTEKRVYLNNKLPSWARAVVPKIFYVTEKCSFLPKFSIHIETKYEDNKGSNDNIFDSEPKGEEEIEVCLVDIAYDEIPDRYYKESEVRRSKVRSQGLGIPSHCFSSSGLRQSQFSIVFQYKCVLVHSPAWI
uniref:Phosphatidylinositol transfer protein N-terminal domain-containing protein n=1 Tax=Oncorhynchus kisutch TaxID=8019 RepID=A0A8C7JLZ0_ONCKI